MDGYVKTVEVEHDHSIPRRYEMRGMQQVGH